MVIDGLDHPSQVQYVEPFLPSRDSGRMLITTRNRLLVQNRVDLKKEPCIEVEHPNEEAALKMFRHYVRESLVGDGEADAKNLLKLLRCPDIILRVAEEMNIKERPCEAMYNIMVTDGLKEIDMLRPYLAEYLLKPILIDPLQFSTEWTTEVELLLQLCMFDNQVGVDFELIRIEYDTDETHSLHNMLATLHACSLVSKTQERLNGTDRTLYHVNTIVELAVSAWIQQNEDKEGFLIRYNKALSMMFRSYNKRWREEKNKIGKVKKSARSYKSIFMPHFDRFVKFTSLAPGPFDFTLYDRAVQAINAFSELLWDYGRHEDAIRVL